MSDTEDIVFHFEPTYSEKSDLKSHGKREIKAKFRMLLNAFLFPPYGLCNNHRIRNAQKMVEFALEYDLEIPPEAKEYVFVQVLLLGYERGTINRVL